MEKYVFSGSLTKGMIDELWHHPRFEPLDILVSQLDKSGVKDAIELKQKGFCRWLFIDSGAYSVHTGKAKCTPDEYIDYLNSIDEYIDVCAQLDTIPGHFQKPKSPEDYVESAKGSWDNYLYMRSKMKSPGKLMPVHHMGESMDHLKEMLEWKDENGNHLDYIGLSPANDSGQRDKNIYIANCNDLIKHSSNPHVKTHLYGMTSLNALSKLNCYSADSVSHRLIAAYSRIYTRSFGVISLSTRVPKHPTNSNTPFQFKADKYNLKKLSDELAEYGYTIEDMQDTPTHKGLDHRVVFNVLSIQDMVKHKFKFDEDKIKAPKKLF